MGNVQALRVLADVFRGGGQRHGDAHVGEVVLVDEHDGHLHARAAADGAEVVRRRRRAVTVERHRHLLRPADHAAQRGAGSEVVARADDAIRAHDPFRHVGDVHRAAVALVVPGLAEEDLGRHLVEISALGDQVPVAAVRAGDVVVLVQHGHDAGGNRFLAHVGMERAVEVVFASQEEILHGGFPPAALVHALIHQEDLLFRQARDEVGRGAGGRNPLGRQELQRVAGPPVLVGARPRGRQPDGFLPLSACQAGGVHVRAEHPLQWRSAAAGHDGGAGAGRSNQLQKMTPVNPAVLS